ncbi:MAG: hypothetical protein RL204_1317 [Bacteroidota bacterium]
MFHMSKPRDEVTVRSMFMPSLFPAKFASMNEIRIFKSRSFGLKVIGMCLPFVLMGYFMLSDASYGSNRYFMSWLGICFFGLGIVAGFFQILDRRPQIIISEYGIWTKKSKRDEVKWEQIIDVYSEEKYTQKHIVLVITDIVGFADSPNSWSDEVNDVAEDQKIKIHLGQVDLDEIELTKFIQQLINGNIENRRKLISSFEFKTTEFSAVLRKSVVYIFLVLVLLLFTLSSLVGFITSMIILGVSAYTARWQPRNLILRKYAGIATWVGFMNLVLCFSLIKVHDHITVGVAEQVTIEIEEFQKVHSTFPTDITSIKQNLDFNFIERYFADQIVYKPLENDYALEAEMLFGRHRVYDRNKGKWR